MSKFYLKKEGGEEEVKFSSEDLPVLVSGPQGSGASFFSVNLISQLLERNRVLFFSQAQPAKDLLNSLVQNRSEIFYLTKKEEISEGINHKVIVLPDGDMNLFRDALPIIEKDRILFVKNFENFVEPKDIEILKERSNFVLAGDLEASSCKTEIDEMSFKTKIFFGTMGVQPRNGYIISSKLKGEIQLLR